MKLVKATEAGMRFPVLGYIPGGELTGWPEMWFLTLHRRKLFDRGIYEGMIVIDARQRRWIARSAYREGRVIRRRWWWPFWPIPDDGLTTIQFDLEEIERIATPELIELVCKARADARTLRKWVPEPEFQKELAKLRKARTVGQIYGILGFDPGFWWGRKEPPAPR